MHLEKMNISIWQETERILGQLMAINRLKGGFLRHVPNHSVCGVSCVRIKNKAEVGYLLIEWLGYQVGIMFAIMKLLSHTDLLNA